MVCLVRLSSSVSGDGLADGGPRSLLGGHRWVEEQEDGGWGQGSDGRGLALQQVLVDVVGVALEPRRVQENVLAALLYCALGRRRVVALKETLKRTDLPFVIRFLEGSQKRLHSAWGLTVFKKLYMCIVA